MVTITTVGYGDMLTLSQEMRMVTAVFGIVGVVQIAGSLNVIADWFVERARKRFMNKQRDLLKEAQEAGARVRDGSASGSGSPINARAAAGEGAEDAAAKDACATALEALAGDTPRRFEQRFGTAASDAPPDASANNEKVTTDLLTDLRTTMEETDQIQELMKKEQERVSQEEMNAKEEKS